MSTVAVTVAIAVLSTVTSLSGVIESTHKSPKSLALTPETGVTVLNVIPSITGRYKAYPVYVPSIEMSNSNSSPGKSTPLNPGVVTSV